MSYILGFTPTVKNLEESDKVKTWYASLLQIKNEKENISFRFVWGGDLYKANLLRTKYNVEGTITIDGEVYASCIFTEYKNEKGVLLIGNWNEGKDYTCIIELT